MFFDPTRIIALFLAFAMGFGLCAGLVVGVPVALLTTYSIRDLENNNIFEIPDEEFIGENPEVDILDLNAIELYEEYFKLQEFGESLTLSVIQERYALKFSSKLEKLLSTEAKSIPLKTLLSPDGLHVVLKSVYIGNIENFECLNPDGTEGDPADPNSYWYNPRTGNRISNLEEIIADFTLDDFVSGNINTDEILHGDLSLSDVLGYTYNEELSCWVDSNDNKVSGVLSVFADCTLDTVDEKINDALIGDLLSYTQGEDGTWYETDENGVVAPVHSFMDAISDKSISTLGTLFETITIGEIIPLEQRESGLISIIPADTTIDQIGNAVNDSVSNTPLQFFINQNLVDFHEVDDKLDMLSHADSNPIYSQDLLVYIPVVAEGEEGYEEFLNCQKYYGVEGNEVWEPVIDASGEVIGYNVETWRTKLLSESFAYVIVLMSGEATK